MKEAFEKLKRKIEARKETVLPERNYMFGKLGVVNAEATNRTIDAVLSIVSKVEAEYINKSSDCSTNADRIRAMSDEELADFIENAEAAGYNDSSITPRGENGYPMDMLEWLKSPIG